MFIHINGTILARLNSSRSFKQIEPSPIFISLVVALASQLVSSAYWAQYNDYTKFQLYYHCGSVVLLRLSKFYNDFPSHRHVKFSIDKINFEPQNIYTLLSLLTRVSDFCSVIVRYYLDSIKLICLKMVYN